MAQQFDLIGMTPQRQHPVADKVGRRFVAREQQQNHEGQQFVGAERFVLVMRRDQRTDQILARLTAPAFYFTADKATRVR